jgi:hypothetical protein
MAVEKWEGQSLLLTFGDEVNCRSVVGHALKREDCFGETPKPTPETDALPGKTERLDRARRLQVYVFA